MTSQIPHDTQSAQEISDEPLVIDALEVRERYASIGCNGVVKLIDFILREHNRGVDIFMIGSREISFGEPIHNLSDKEIEKLPAHYLGSVDGSLGPIEDIGSFDISEAGDELHMLDTFCAELATENEWERVYIGKLDIETMSIARYN